MSYVVQLWQQQPGEAMPASVDEAMRQLDAASDGARVPRSTFEELLHCLTRRHPDITSPEAGALPQERLAWSDGPLRAGNDPVLVLGLNLPMCDIVRPFIIEQAMSLGLHVADPQAGEVHLANGDVLSVRAEDCEARAQAGDVEAMYELAEIFARLRRQQSLHWFRRAAEQGHAGAQYELALRLRRGVDGAALDPSEAFRWCSLAGEQGNGFALRVLGQMHQNGEGTPADISEAIRCYRAAIENGTGLARHSLAALYANGTGVPRDLDEAQRLYKEGVRAGEAACMSGWALLFNRTRRAEDQVPMLALRIRAAAADPRAHGGILEVLRDTMSPAVIAEAEKLSASEDLVSAIEARTESRRRGR